MRVGLWTGWIDGWIDVFRIGPTGWIDVFRVGRTGWIEDDPGGGGIDICGGGSSHWLTPVPGGGRYWWKGEGEGVDIDERGYE